MHLIPRTGKGAPHDLGVNDVVDSSLNLVLHYQTLFLQIDVYETVVKRKEGGATIGPTDSFLDEWDP